MLEITYITDKVLLQMSVNSTPDRLLRELEEPKNTSNDIKRSCYLKSSRLMTHKLCMRLIIDTNVK